MSPVPIIGQPQPTPYTIAGHTLGFGPSPDEIASLHAYAISQGLQMGCDFVLLWQRTSMAFEQLIAAVENLNARLDLLEGQVDTASDCASANSAPTNTGGSDV